MAGAFAVYCFARVVRRRMTRVVSGEYEVLVGKW